MYINKLLSLAPCLALLATLSLCAGHAQGQTTKAGAANVTAARQLPEDYVAAIERYRKREQAKIINGVAAAPNSHPWQVSLGVAWIADQKQAHFCGGSLVDDKWIMTAAHCVRGLLMEDFLVVAGTTILNQSNTRYGPARVIVHPDYNWSIQDNDVALIELRDPVKFSASIKPIQLVSSIEDEAKLVQGKKLRVTGWGAIEQGGKGVAALQYIDVPYISRKTCNSFNSYNGRITDAMMCAGTIPKIGANTIYQDSCQGDSGGPLVASIGSSKPVLVGVTSWGDGCGQPNKFGVYTRLAIFSSWIEKCRSGSSDC